MVNGIDGKGNSGEDEERIPEGDSDEWEAFRDSVKEDAETRETEEADLSPPPDDKDLPVFEEMSLGEHLGGVIEKPLEEVVDELDAKLRTVEMQVVDENYVASDKVHGYIGTLNTNNDFRLSPQDSSEIEQIIRRRFGEKEETYEKVKIQALVEEFTSNPEYIKQKLKEDIVGVIMDSKLTPKPAESEIEELVLDRCKDVLERPLSIKMLEKFVVLKSMHVYMGKAGIPRIPKEEKGILEAMAKDLGGRPVSSITNAGLERAVVMYGHIKEIKREFNARDVPDGSILDDLFGELNGRPYDRKDDTKIIEISVSKWKGILEKEKRRQEARKKQEALALQQKEHGGGPMEPTQPSKPERKQYKPQPGDKYKRPSLKKSIGERLKLVLKPVAYFVGFAALAVGISSILDTMKGRSEYISHLESQVSKEDFGNLENKFTRLNTYLEGVMTEQQKKNAAQDVGIAKGIAKAEAELKAVREGELKAIRGDVSGLKKSTTTQIGELSKTEKDRYTETTTYRRELGERLTGVESAQETTSGGVENLNSLFAGFKGDYDKFKKDLYEKFAALSGRDDGLKDKLDFIIKDLKISKKLREEVPGVGPEPENGEVVPENGEVVPENGEETPDYENGETLPENGEMKIPGIEKTIEEVKKPRERGTLDFDELLLGWGVYTRDEEENDLKSHNVTQTYELKLAVGSVNLQALVGFRGNSGTLTGDLDGEKDDFSLLYGFRLKDAIGDVKIKVDLYSILHTLHSDVRIPSDDVHTLRWGSTDKAYGGRLEIDKIPFYNLSLKLTADYSEAKGDFDTKTFVGGALLNRGKIRTESKTGNASLRVYAFDDGTHRISANFVYGCNKLKEKELTTRSEHKPGFGPSLEVRLSDNAKLKFDYIHSYSSKKHMKNKWEGQGKVTLEVNF